MSLHTRPLTADDVAAIKAWHYPPPFDVHDPERDAERLSRMSAAPEYRAVADESGLAAFYCTGPDARPEGRVFRDEAVDFAIFLRPDLVGRGEGPAILTAALDDVGTRHASQTIRVTIASANVRALRLARKAGFREHATFGGFRHGLPPHVVLLRG